MDLAPSAPSTSPETTIVTGPAKIPSDSAREAFLMRVFVEILQFGLTSQKGSLLVIVRAAAKILTAVPVGEFESLRIQVVDGKIKKAAGIGATLASKLTELELAYDDDPAETEVAILEEAAYLAGYLSKAPLAGREAAIEKEIHRLAPKHASSKTREHMRDMAMSKVDFRYWLEMVSANCEDTVTVTIFAKIGEFIHRYVNTPNDLVFWQKKATRAIAGEYTNLGQFAREVPEAFVMADDDLRVAAAALAPPIKDAHSPAWRRS